MDAVLPAFPSAAAELGVAASGIQATMTAYLAGLAVGQLAFGALSDRWGRRTPLLVGVAVTAIAALAAALAPSLTVLLVARAVQGVGASSTMVLARAIVRDLTEGAETTRALSTVTAISGAAAIFAPIAGGLLNEAAGWRAPLWLLVALSLAVFVCVATLVPETHPDHDGRSMGRLARQRMHLQKGFGRYLGVQACATGTMMAYVASSPFLYQGVLGFDAGQYGLLFAGNAALGVLINLAVNRGRRRRDQHRIAAVGFAISLAGTTATALALLVHAPAAVVAATVCVSMCTLAANAPNVLGLALNRVGAGVGTAAALIGFVQFATGAAISPVMGLGPPQTHIVPLVSMALTATVGMVLMLVPRR